MTHLTPTGSHHPSSSTGSKCGKNESNLDSQGTATDCHHSVLTSALMKEACQKLFQVVLYTVATKCHYSCHYRSTTVFISLSGSNCESFGSRRRTAFHSGPRALMGGARDPTIKPWAESGCLAFGGLPWAGSPTATHPFERATDPERLERPRNGRRPPPCPVPAARPGATGSNGHRPLRPMRKRVCRHMTWSPNGDPMVNQYIVANMYNMNRDQSLPFFRVLAPGLL